MLNTEQLIRAEFDEKAGVLVIKRLARLMRIIGTTIPLSVRNDNAVECFSILPFEEEDGLILVNAHVGSHWTPFFIYVKKQSNGLPFAHYMNNDEEKWNTNVPYITQSYNSFLEIIVGSDRFTTDMNGYEYDVNVIDGDSICLLLLGQITEEEFRSRVSRISGKEALKQELIKKSQLLQETEELLSNAQRENSIIRLDLAAEKVNVTKAEEQLTKERRRLSEKLEDMTRIVNELRQLYRDLSRPFWQRWRILQIRLRNISLIVFGEEDYIC